MLAAGGCQGEDEDQGEAENGRFLSPVTVPRSEAEAVKYGLPCCVSSLLWAQGGRDGGKESERVKEKGREG